MDRLERGPILRTVSSLVFPFMVVLVIYLLLNGHNRAGGGFIAGVMMSGAIGFQYLAHGKSLAPKFVLLPYREIFCFGLLLSIAVGVIALVRGYPFLTSFHAKLHIPFLDVIGKVTPMEFGLAQVFDVGIFLVVVGGLVTAILALQED